MKCDLHVHTVHSGMCTVPVANRFCRESYNQPLAVYEKLKRAGMDLVTITDHDSIDAVEELRRYPDFFLSEEVTCTMPSGTEAHIGVYGITEQHHIELQRRRDDFLSFLAYVQEKGLLFSINHLFSSLTGKRDWSDFEWFERAFPCAEARNGAMPERVNRRAAEWARAVGKPVIGGSDAHAMVSVGRAFTVVPDASNVDEFLSGVRMGKSDVRGSAGDWWKLTRDVLSICGSLYRETPWARPLIPLAAAVPVITAAHTVLEFVFAEYWFARVINAAKKNPATCEAWEASI